MLKTLSKKEENRILRSIALACTDSMEQLNKYAYNWLHIKSGFIAHYNLQGFQGSYYPAQLRTAILDNERWNTSCNYRESEADYPYYKQKADMYKRLCDILRGNRRVPAESTARVRIPSIKKYCKGFDLYSEQLIEQHTERFINVFACGTFFCGDYHTRSVDLAYFTLAYEGVTSEGKSTEEFLQTEYIYPSGNTGTGYALMRNYGDHLWDLVAELTGQLEPV